MGVVHLARKPGGRAGGAQGAPPAHRRRRRGPRAARPRGRLAQPDPQPPGRRDRRRRPVGAGPVRGHPLRARALAARPRARTRARSTGADLVWFARCLAEALAAVHAAGVLHRDIKPSNVLMEGRTPILIDFGLARRRRRPPAHPHRLAARHARATSRPRSCTARTRPPPPTCTPGRPPSRTPASGRPPFGSGPSMAIMDRVRRGEHDLERRCRTRCAGRAGGPGPRPGATPDAGPGPGLARTRQRRADPTPRGASRGGRGPLHDAPRDRRPAGIAPVTPPRPRRYAPPSSTRTLPAGGSTVPPGRRPRSSSRPPRQPPGRTQRVDFWDDDWHDHRTPPSRRLGRTAAPAPAPRAERLRRGLLLWRPGSPWRPGIAAYPVPRHRGRAGARLAAAQRLHDGLGHRRPAADCAAPPSGTTRCSRPCPRPGTWSSRAVPGGCCSSWARRDRHRGRPCSAMRSRGRCRAHWPRRRPGAGGLWWGLGPGGSRVRRPLARLVRPLAAARRTGSLADAAALAASPARRMLWAGRHRGRARTLSRSGPLARPHGRARPDREIRARLGRRAWQHGAVQHARSSSR